MQTDTPPFIRIPSTPDEQDITETADGDLATRNGGAGMLLRPHTARDKDSEVNLVSYGPTGYGPRASHVTAYQSSDSSARDDEQPGDNNSGRFLESSSAFQGALLLVAWPYVELAIYLIIGNRKGLVRPVSEQALSLVVVNPLLQAFWLVYTTWDSRIPVGPPVIRFDVFATLLAASFIQNKEGLYYSALGLGILLGVYIILALWATTIARGPGKPSTRPPTWKSRLIVCGALMAGSAPSFLARLQFIPIPVAFHVVLLFVTRLPWNFGRVGAFSCTLFIIAAIGFQGWWGQAEAETEGKRDPVVTIIFSTSFTFYPQFQVVVDYPLWMFGWVFVIALWPLGRHMARGIEFLAERFFRSRNIGL